MSRRTNWGAPVAFGLALALAVFLGLLIAVSPAMAGRAGLVLLLALAAVLAWVVPNSRGTHGTIGKVVIGFAFVAVAWPRYVVWKAGGLPALSPEKLAFIALLVVWFWVTMTSATVRATLKERFHDFKPVLVALGLLVLWRLLSISAGEPAWYFMGAKVAITELFAYYLMLVIGLSVWRAPGDVRLLMWSVVLGGIVVCAIGSYELRVSRNLFAAFASLDEDATGRLGEALREKFRGGKYRVQSGFEHPLVFAGFLIMALPCALYLAITVRGFFVRAGLVLTMALFAAMAYKTDSRAAVGVILFMLVLAPLLFAYRSFRVSRSILGVVVGLAVPALLLLVPLVLGLVAGVITGGDQTTSASTSARIFMLERGIPLVLENPLFGFGVNQGGSKVGYVLSSGLLSLDNHYLGLALDSGIPALVAYLFVMGWFGYKLIVQVGARSCADGPLAICLLLALIGFVAMQAILSITTNSWLLFLLMSTICVLSTARHSNDGLPGFAGGHLAATDRL